MKKILQKDANTNLVVTLPILNQLPEAAAVQFVQKVTGFIHFFLKVEQTDLLNHNYSLRTVH